ncbi:50S ribosomal protein L4 [Patescibacteria group bacterium]
MKIDVIDTTGKKVKQADLPKDIADVEISKDFLSDVITRQMAQSRTPYAHTKTRSERRGGGIKPWRQKGTGRARVGSNRSPIWRKGGVTFGPRSNRNFYKKINSREVQKAFRMALSYQAKEGTVVVLQDMNVEPKTKQLAEFLKKAKIEKSVLFITHEKNESLKKAAANLPQASVKTLTSVTPRDLLMYDTVILSADSLKILEGSKK